MEYTRQPPDPFDPEWPYIECMLYPAVLDWENLIILDPAYKSEVYWINIMALVKLDGDEYVSVLPHDYIDLLEGFEIAGQIKTDEGYEIRWPVQGYIMPYDTAELRIDFPSLRPLCLFFYHAIIDWGWNLAGIASEERPPFVAPYRNRPEDLEGLE